MITHLQADQMSQHTVIQGVEDRQTRVCAPLLNLSSLLRANADALASALDMQAIEEVNGDGRLLQ